MSNLIGLTSPTTARALYETREKARSQEMALELQQSIESGIKKRFVPGGAMAITYDQAISTSDLESVVEDYRKAGWSVMFEGSPRYLVFREAP